MRFLSWFDVSWIPLITVLFENILPLLKWFHLQSFLPQKKNLVKEIQAKRAQTTLRRMRVHKRNFFLLLPACVTPSNSRISYEYQNILSTMDNVYVTKLRQATAHNDHLSIMALHHMRKNSFGLREPVPMRFISKSVLFTFNGVFFPKDILDLPPLFTNSARSASDPNNFVPQLNAEIFPDLFVNYLCKIAILVFKKKLKK